MVGELVVAEGVEDTCLALQIKGHDRVHVGVPAVDARQNVRLAVKHANAGIVVLVYLDKLRVKGLVEDVVHGPGVVL